MFFECSKNNEKTFTDINVDISGYQEAALYIARWMHGNRSPEKAANDERGRSANSFFPLYFLLSPANTLVIAYTKKQALTSTEIFTYAKVLVVVFFMN